MSYQEWVKSFHQKFDLTSLYTFNTELLNVPQNESENEPGFRVVVGEGTIRHDNYEERIIVENDFGELGELTGDIFGLGSFFKAVEEHNDIADKPINVQVRTMAWQKDGVHHAAVALKPFDKLEDAVRRRTRGITRDQQIKKNMSKQEYQAYLDKKFALRA
ncbi:hypothetical protein [Corynebacterium lubricantis]|uniref:hypothetical protein n=1 Tax=Corynebacterium lubricantis TaxID=541095 RepID=UPI00037491BC|nr:hypothetical protein [Corynebacterium lubricantis]